MSGTMSIGGRKWPMCGSSSISATLSSSGARDGGVDDSDETVEAIECLVPGCCGPGTICMFWRWMCCCGGEAERDFAEMGGETDAVEVLGARWPRCLQNRLTISSWSGSLDSSMPSKVAAASIIWTCWCLDSINLVAL